MKQNKKLLILISQPIRKFFKYPVFKNSLMNPKQLYVDDLISRYIAFDELPKHQTVRNLLDELEKLPNFEIYDSMEEYMVPVKVRNSTIKVKPSSYLKQIENKCMQKPDLLTPPLYTAFKVYDRVKTDLKSHTFNKYE